MSSAPSWQEQPGDLPAELVRALRAAPGEPNAVELASLASRLDTALGLGIVLPQAAATKVLAASKPALGVISSTLIGVAVGVGLSAAVALLIETDEQPEVGRGAAAVPSGAPPPPPMPAASQAAVPVVEARPQSANVEPRVSLPLSSANTSRDGGPLEAMEAELALLRQARALLISNPGRALALCTDHSRMFGAGVLMQEREVIAIDALLRAGRTAEARERARSFSASFPGSAHARRVASLLEAASQR